MPEIVIFAISIAAVIKGADWLGEASVDVAKRLGIPQLLIGATLVAVATTLPETLISFYGGVAEESGISLGTVIGSPVANLGLILGILFLFGHAKPERGYFTRTINIFIFLLALVLALGINGSITPFGGWMLLALSVIYLTLEFLVSKSEESFVDRIESRFEKATSFLFHSDGYKDILFFVLGAVVLGVGAKFLVDSTVVIAHSLNIPTIIVAATAIAFGTSLPELATAIHSIIKGRLGLSIGNLAGASVLDFTMALGAGAIINTLIIPKEALFLSIGTLFILSLLSLAAVLTKISTEKIGIALIVVFVVFVTLFVSVEMTI
jgi:cation:H+ antiporter